MKVLITGSSGFVGNALLKRLNDSEDGNEFFLLSSKTNDQFPTFLYERKEGRYSFSFPDRFDMLVHLGAWTPKSSEDAQNVDGAFDNIQFTKSLIASLSHIQRVIYISTLDVYAPCSSVITESSPLDPISLYGWSKLYCEQMVKVWSQKHDISCCILRLGHIYGVGEGEYQKLIPILIKKAINNEPISIFSSGNEIRSYLNIEDCAGVIQQAMAGRMEGVYNVVSNNSVRVKDVAEMIKKLASSDSFISVLNRSVATRDYLFDNSHLMQEFAICEKPFEQGLKEEIAYFRKRLA